MNMVPTEWKTQLKLNVADGNKDLMHEFCPQHMRMGTERMKEDRETKKEKQQRVNIEISKAGTK